MTRAIKSVTCWSWAGKVYRPELPTFFFIPGAGANHATYAMLTPHLASINCGFWRMPGRGGRSDEPIPDDLSALADEVAATIQEIRPARPVVGGHSFGGLLAFLTCHALEKRDVEVGRFAPIASGHPTSWRVDSLYTRAKFHLTTMPGRSASNIPIQWRMAMKRLEILERGGHFPSTPISDPVMLQEARNRALADGALGYQGFDASPIDASITDITPSDDDVLRLRNPRRWAPYTRGEFESIVISGGHSIQRDNPKQLAATICNIALLADSWM